MILYLDTSAKTGKVWLGPGSSDEKRVTVCAEFDLDRAMARDLLGCLDDFLKKNGTNWHELTGLALMKGPGSFTGLRIGASILNAVADAEKIPIVGEIDGEQWRMVAKNRLIRGENDKVVLPFYNSEAHTT